jgi:cytochrome c-type biogenesis protein CcmF
LVSLLAELAWSGVGGLLLLVAVAAGGSALWLEAGSVYTGSRRWARAAGRLQRTMAASLAAALVVLAGAFLRVDLGYRYVWAHTAETLPWYYRLAGTWAGSEGTTLLWAAVTAGALARLLPRLRAEAPDRLASATHLVVGGFTVALAGFLVAESPFAATDPALLADPATAGGAGLNELLVTPLMVIHPPVQFLAYGLAAVPGGLALAGWATGEGDWLEPARDWGRAAWLAATAGLGLGALWAYYVLSFGGYWVWDPVETANVLPWVGLLAFLHAARDRETHGGALLAAPLLAVASWLATVFATVAVRSGLWTSVHAFTDPTDVFQPDAGRRLLDILAVHPSTAFFVGLGLAMAFLAAGLALRRHGPEAARGHRLRLVQAGVGLQAGLAGLALFAPRPVVAVVLEAGRLLVPASPPAGLGLVVTVLLGGPLLAAAAGAAEPRQRGAWARFLGLATLLLALAGAVTFLLLVRSVNGFTPGFYDERVPFVALPIAATMTAMLAWHPLGPRRALALAGAGAVGAAAAAWAAPVHWALAGAVPALGAGLAASLPRLRGVAARRDLPEREEAAAGLVLAAGLLGVVTWSNPPSSFATPWGLVPVSAGAAGLLWPASLVALVGALAAFRGGPRRLARAGAAAGAAAAGLVAGALLGLAGLVLLRGSEAEAGPRPWLDLAAAGRRYAIHVAHLGALVGLLGWVASTYGGAAATFTAAPGGEPVDWAGGTLVLGGARGEPDPGGEGFAAVEVPVDVLEGGSLQSEGVLRLYRRGPPVDHYDPHVDVRRGVAEDVVLHPRAFRTPADGWVEAHGDTSWMTSADVREARFSAELRPGMSLLWGGLSLVVAGTAGLVAADRAVRREGS